MSSEIDWKKMMADVEQKNRNTANETFKEIIPEHIIKEQCACLEVVNDFGIVDKLSSIKDQLWGMGDVQITNGSGYIFNEYIQNWQNHDFWTRQNSKLSIVEGLRKKRSKNLDILFSRIVLHNLTFAESLSKKRLFGFAKVELNADWPVYIPRHFKEYHLNGEEYGDWKKSQVGIQINRLSVYVGFRDQGKYAIAIDSPYEGCVGDLAIYSALNLSEGEVLIPEDMDADKRLTSFLVKDCVERSKQFPLLPQAKKDIKILAQVTKTDSEIAEEKVRVNIWINNFVLKYGQI